MLPSALRQKVFIHSSVLYIVLGETGDKELLEQAAAGDSRAFGLIYERMAPAIYRHAFFRVSDKALAEDLMSEVFVKTWEYLADGKPVDNLKSFIYRVANNLIIDHYRRKDKEPVRIDDDLERTLKDKSDTIGPIDRGLALETVQEAMSRLPDDYRLIVSLKFFEDMSYDEIAKATGKSKNAVYIAAHRGIRELVALLEKVQA